MTATVEIPTPNPTFAVPATAERIDRAAAALTDNGFNVVVVRSGAEAFEQTMALLPEGAEVFDGLSETFETIGVTAEVANSGRYQAIRPKLMELYAAGDRDAMRRVGAAPEYMVGSVHAITEAGEIVIGSGTGSQLGPFAYSAANAIWIVGHQKLVGTLDEGLQRVREYSLPKESERMFALRGAPSSLNKILIITKEHVPGRSTVIIVREELGF